MGYLAYEAASLLDGHPAPEPGDAPCPPVGLLVIDRAVVFDHWRQRLILIAHVPAGGYDDGVRAVHDLAARIASAETPALAPSVSPQGSLRRRGGEHARRGLPVDGLGVQGAHPGRGHLPGRALEAGHVRRAGRRLPDLPPPPRHEPRPVHVLRADARDGARRIVARTARTRRRPAGLRPPDRRHAAPGTDRDPRPAPGARAARRPEGAGGARDAGRPRPQRPRSRVRRRLGPSHRADGGRAVHEGDAHRLDRGGRAPRRAASAGRAGGDVPCRAP